jgi:hypothetical protein
MVFYGHDPIKEKKENETKGLCLFKAKKKTQKC